MKLWVKNTLQLVFVVPGMLMLLYVGVIAMLWPTYGNHWAKPRFRLLGGQIMNVHASTGAYPKSLKDLPRSWNPMTCMLLRDVEYAAPPVVTAPTDPAADGAADGDLAEAPVYVILSSKLHKLAFLSNGKVEWGKDQPAGTLWVPPAGDAK